MVISYDYTVLAGHPGPHEPQEDRPHARARRAMAAAAGVLRRRRRRPSRRYRPARHDRPRRAVLRAVRQTVRTGAGHRRRVRLLLRRQRCDARLLRRDHCHQERVDRHGRSGDDRRRRPRRLPSGRSRPGVVPVAERRHRHPRRGRSGSNQPPRKNTCRIFRARLPTGRRRTSGCCGGRSRKTACASTTSGPSSICSPTRDRCSKSAAISASA